MTLQDDFNRLDAMMQFSIRLIYRMTRNDGVNRRTARISIHSAIIQHLEKGEK